MGKPVANVERVVPKSVVWVGSSKENLKAFPEPVQKGVGYGLWFAQIGSKHPHAKVLRGFGGAGVVEIIEHWEGNTYRAVYTVKFGGLCLCAALLPEEVEARSADAIGRRRIDQVAAPAC